MTAREHSRAVLATFLSPVLVSVVVPGSFLVACGEFPAADSEAAAGTAEGAAGASSDVPEVGVREDALTAWCWFDWHCPASQPRCSEGRCVECAGAADCEVLGQCRQATCTEGACALAIAASGTSCANGGVCNGTGQCMGCTSDSECIEGVCLAGRCVECTTNSDCPALAECQQPVCSHNQCESVAAPAGMACSGGACDGSGQCRSGCLSDEECGGDGVCADGQCVECVRDADCPEVGDCRAAVCSDNRCAVAAAPVGSACSGGVCNAEGACECQASGDCGGGLCWFGRCLRF